MYKSRFKPQENYVTTETVKEDNLTFLKNLYVSAMSIYVYIRPRGVVNCKFVIRHQLL